MGEIDPLILSYSHLVNFPREKEALQTLKKVSSLVKPIMRARGWRVNQLTEFYPDQPNLLGLNVGGGQKICLRLRYASDSSLFMSTEAVLDTMLHELAHIVHGPHDDKFHALWNQLRDEQDALVRKGYTGEGFLSAGRRLGGQRIPRHEARRLARAAAEEQQQQQRQKKKQSAGPGQRLGGAAPRPEQDIRRVIAAAAERRRATLRGCGNGGGTEAERRRLAEAATRGGRRTRADDDTANDAAIAQALWELVQEEERERLGDAYVPPRAGRFWEEQGQEQQEEAAAAERSGGGGGGGTQIRGAPPESRTPPAWACPVCTLENPAALPRCDACESPRPERARRPPPVIDLTRSPPRAPSRTTGAGAGAGATRPATWTCAACGRVRAREWWSCDRCGAIKTSSR
ncbi:WLM-domain-containing protein [Durotheca rogersii]|uniref:WLM-domain-containing protein n=1 Tax=Durotheca rogersii TaxID=419775 RepID=UPI00222124EC|nr:WLM-domain-containing protein [Durotheca rogersii]KAI5865734.1 WLM-domain-containing protein [Durotheca rogersii]